MFFDKAARQSTRQLSRCINRPADFCKLSFFVVWASAPWLSPTFTRADELPLPEATVAAPANTIEPAPPTSTPAEPVATAVNAKKSDLPVVELPVVEIRSPVPSYIDQGVTMVPLSPIAGFLGIKIASHDGVLTLTQRIAQTKTIKVATIRQGGKTAQIVSNASSRSLPLMLPAETRLGNTFIPLRFLIQAFGAQASFRVPDNAVVLTTPTRIGVLTPNNPREYSGKSAAIVTITNRIGRPLTLRLNGPQKVSLELGRGQSFTRRMAPGAYYYQAVSAGMKPISGGRRFLPGRKVSWTWGRR